MTATLPRRLLALALVAALAAGAALAQKADPDPEPPGGKGDEEAKPAVDLKKAETDAKLAQQATANQTKSRRNLQMIGLAVHNFHDANGRLPDDITDTKGKALLSWRVQLLPYLEQDKLYRELKLNEAWDSPHNKKVLEKVPDVYRSPRVTLQNKGNTVYQAFHGKNAVFGRGGKMSLVGMTDGTSNTILVVESSGGVPWTKPGGLEFDRAKAVPDIGKAYGKRPQVVMGDGSVRVLDLNKVSEATLKNAIDPQDGMILGADWR